MDIQIKLCCECVWFEPADRKEDDDVCGNINSGTLDLVRGRHEKRFCRSARIATLDSRCGPTGIYWEASKGSSPPVG
jgi:hypothetical protein